jgi:hypothetical protein
MIELKNRDALIRVVIPIIMVPMMVPVPPLPLVPAIFVRVMVVAVSVIAIVIRPVLLVARINVNPESIICFGLSRCQSNQPENR